jgi:diguanylate cyclase (GGDEF)-like protein
MYYNAALGSCLTIILITVDYLRKFNTDNFQRKLLIIILSAVFVSVILDFAYHILSDIHNESASRYMYFVVSAYMISRNFAYYTSVAFIDYFSHGNAPRSKKIFYAICVFISIFAVSVILNLPFGYYFSISSDNVYMPGKLFPALLLLNYATIIIIIADIILAPKHFKQVRVFLLIVFVIIIAAGATIDTLLEVTSLTWPCATLAILYIYFFIIKSDSKIDSLTGIGNRYSFNEFVNKLSRQNAREEYTFVMIDIDRFKDINDTLGHLEGDNALRDTAVIIKSCIRHTDFAARFGGDEFVLVTRAENAMKRIIDRINESIAVQNQKRVRPYQLYISWGYDVYTTNSGQSIQEFLAHIDNLMYQHKESRRKTILSVITRNGTKNV